MDQGVCRSCGLLFLDSPQNCPQCGDVVTTARQAPGSPVQGSGASTIPPPSGSVESSRPVSWEIAHECRQHFEAITLQVELERHGILSWIRSLEVGGYPGIVFNETVWGWLLVDTDDLESAREVIQQFFDQMQSGAVPEPGAGRPEGCSDFRGDREE